MQLLTVSEVSDLTRRHAETVTNALRGGSLHGYQSKKRAPWVVQQECALAWRLGQPCEHQQKEAA